MIANMVRTMFPIVVGHLICALKFINGNDPIETYMKLEEIMSYIRKERKPVVLEAKTSRLYGHSSADGANRRDGEIDPC